MKKFLLFLFSLMVSIPTLFAGEVSFYFQDGEEDDFELTDPSSLVLIWNNTAETPVSIPSGETYMPFSFTNATNLRIYPEDFDYELVVTVDGNEDMYMLEQEETEWYLTLFPNADNLEIFVKVYLAGQAPGSSNSGVNMTFNISAASGSGIANPGNLVGISYFDLSSFSDKEVTISDNYGEATVTAGTTFTLSPAEGYVISDITTFSSGVASISEPGDDSEEWNVAVDWTPAGNFASFFVTVDKAVEEPKEPDTNAVITHIEPLQWTVAWEDFDYINPLDTEYDNVYATLTNASGATTILHSSLHGYQNPQIIFTENRNYFTLNLEGLNLADGSYQLNIPAGYVSMTKTGVVSQLLNPAQSLGLIIGESVDVQYPVQISAVNDNYFDITWKNVTLLTEKNTTGAYMVNLEDNTRYDLYFLEDYYYSKANLMINNNNILRVNLTNNYPDLPSGSYKFYLPADYVTFNGTQTGNEAINGYEFTYVAAWTEGEVELNGPSDDNKITVTWVDASKIEYVADYAGDGDKIYGVTIYDSTDAKIDVSYANNITISGNAMTIDLNGLNIADGLCHLLIPEECLWITVNDVTDLTYGQSFYFNYGDAGNNPEDPDLYTGAAIWNVKSGSEVKAGSTVQVGWGDMQLSFVKDAEKASIHTFETGILYLDYGSQVYLSEDKTRIVLDLSKMPSGAFRINIPEACVEFKVDGVTYRNQGTSMDNVIINNVGGINGVETEDGHYRVVNVNGVVILDTDNAADLQNLAKGLYIINGRKVVI